MSAIWEKSQIIPYFLSVDIDLYTIHHSTPSPPLQYRARGGDPRDISLWTRRSKRGLTWHSGLVWIQMLDALVGHIISVTSVHFNFWHHNPSAILQIHMLLLPNTAALSNVGSILWHHNPCVGSFSLAWIFTPCLAQSDRDLKTVRGGGRRRGGLWAKSAQKVPRAACSHTLSTVSFLVQPLKHLDRSFGEKLLFETSPPKLWIPLWTMFVNK